MVRQAISDNDLHAYVDGCLDPERRLTVEAWLAQDTEAVSRIAHYRSQNEALHDLFDPVLTEPMPPGMTELGERLQGRLPGNDNRFGGRPWTWMRTPMARMAAAIALIVAAGTAGYGLHDQPAPAPQQQKSAGLQTFAEEAVQAHAFYTSEGRSPVEMGADDRGALDSWVSQRLGRTIFGPDLSAVGYHLIGGRLLPTATGAGAQYMYENDQKRRLTLFVGTPHAGQEAAFSFVQQGDVAMFYWLEGSLGYALIGKLSRDELMEITKAVYRELKTRPPTPPPAPAGTTPNVTAPQPGGPVQPANDTKPKQM